MLPISEPKTQLIARFVVRAITIVNMLLQNVRIVLGISLYLSLIKESTGKPPLFAEWRITASRGVMCGLRLLAFGSIRIDGITYEHDVLIDRGEIRKRNKKPSKKYRNAFGHAPLSLERRSPGMPPAGHWHRNGGTPGHDRSEGRGEAASYQADHAFDCRGNRTAQAGFKKHKHDPTCDLLIASSLRRIYRQLVLRSRLSHYHRP